MAHSVTIVGLGLIGGSLGIALRHAGWRVAFVDPGVSLDEAQRAGAADERLETIGGTMIVLAVPVDVAVAQLAALRVSDALVTSTCSVMRALIDAAGDAANDDANDAATDIQFIAGHPFAGSERQGLDAADGTLFQKRPWFVSRADARVEQLVRDAGAIPVVVEPDEHDRVMALTSHLPQIVSTALASLLHDVDPLFIGSGAASVLRLAGSAEDVWRPVLDANSDNVAAAIEQLLEAMRTLARADFERANETYAKLRR